MVISKSGINIRTDPNKNSEIKTSVPFGEMVTKLNDPDLKPKIDTLENLPGLWEAVKYGTNTGYAFNAYFTNSIQDLNPDFSQEQSQFLFEGELMCGDHVFLNTKLNWYGIYKKRHNSYQIKSIDITIEPFYSPDGYIKYKIRTQDSLKSEFLYGTVERINEQEIFLARIPNIDFGNHENKFLYPGMSIPVGYDRNRKIAYKLDVVGSVDSAAFVNHLNSNVRPKINSYQLRLTGFDGEGFVLQNLINEINIQHHDFIEILFACDLNQDGTPDFIINSSETNGGELYRHLIMSNQENDKLVMKVFQNYWGSCY